MTGDTCSGKTRPVVEYVVWQQAKTMLPQECVGIPMKFQRICKRSVLSTNPCQRTWDVTCRKDMAGSQLAAATSP